MFKVVFLSDEVCPANTDGGQPYAYCEGVPASYGELVRAARLFYNGHRGKSRLEFVSIVSCLGVDWAELDADLLAAPVEEPNELSRRASLRRFPIPCPIC